MRIGLGLTVVAACGAPPQGQVVTYAPVQVAWPRSCEPSLPLPVLDPVFVPAVSGRVQLVEARGDARLGALSVVSATWSADSAYVALSDAGTLTVWRGSDGAVVDAIACPGPEVGGNAFVMSPDLRWVVITGPQRVPYHERPATCIIDRVRREARVIAGEIVEPRFAGDTVIGTDRSIDLTTGAVTERAPDPPAARPPRPAVGFDISGADELAVSHDGRYLAGWTTYRDQDYEQHGDLVVAQPMPPALLTVWDLATGRRLWRTATTCCDRWAFGADDHLLAGSLHGWSSQVLRAATGEAVPLPEHKVQVSPDATRVVAYGEHGVELWSIDPASRLGAPPRRVVIARSRDGAVIAATEPLPTRRDRQLVIEREGRCVGLGAAVDVHDALELSPDGRELHAGIVAGYPDDATRDGQRLDGIVTSTLVRWGTATGASVGSTSISPPTRIVPLPASGWFAVTQSDGIRIHDAQTGRALRFAAAPRATWSPPDVRGDRHLIRKLDGDVADGPHGEIAAFRDRRHLAVSSGAVALAIWDMDDPRRVQDLPWPAARSYVTALAIAPGERHLAAGTGDGGILLWTRAGAPIFVAARHDGPVEAVAFSPDGRLLATAGGDRAVVIIDVATGAEAGRIALTADLATLLWWSADGARLVIDTARRFQITATVTPAPP